MAAATPRSAPRSAAANPAARSAPSEIKVGDEIVSVDGDPFHPVLSFKGKADKPTEIKLRRSPQNSYTIRVVPVKAGLFLGRLLHRPVVLSRMIGLDAARPSVERLQIDVRRNLDLDGPQAKGLQHERLVIACRAVAQRSGGKYYK